VSFPAALGIIVVLSYLLGSIPFGYVLVRIVKGVDIRAVGSGNVGATNVMRVAGRKLGLAVLGLDALKGFVAVYFVGGTLVVALTHTAAANGVWFALAAGAGAILGHVFTIFLKFRGGKGVATGLGAVLGLVPAAALCALAAFIIVVAFSRYVSLGSITAAVVLVIAELLLDKNTLGAKPPLTVFCVAMALLVIARHVSNIKRLLSGTENKFSLAHKPEADEPSK